MPNLSNNPGSLVTLETERLWIRSVHSEDYEALCVLDTDPEVRHYFPEGPLSEIEVRRELARYLVEWKTWGFGMFAVTEKITRRLMGRAGFARLKSGEVEFGYLFLKEYWGKGYATEASKALLKWGLKNIPADHIIGFAPLNHPASVRVLEKCGMQYFKTELYQNLTCVFYKIEFSS